MKPEPVCYLLNSGRPIGLEPTIYLSRPVIPDEEPNPWTPEIIECYSFQDALSRILHFNLKLALDKFKVVR